MQFLRKLFRVLRPLPKSWAEPALLQTGASIRALQRHVETGRCIEAWWTARRDRANEDIASWEGRILKCSDPELRAKATDIIAEAERIFHHAEVNTLSLRDWIDDQDIDIKIRIANFTALRERVAADGYDVSAISLDFDPAAIRAEVEREMTATMPKPSEPNEERAFLEELFARMAIRTADGS